MKKNLLNICVLCLLNTFSCFADVHEVDLRTKFDIDKYYVIFAARESTRPDESNNSKKSITGHAFVMWSKEDIFSSRNSFFAYGFYPKEGIGILGDVPGNIVDDIASFRVASDQLVFIVDKLDFENSKRELVNWKAGGPYRLVKSDCVTFIQKIGESLGIEMPNKIKELTFKPVPYVRMLINKFAKLHVSDKAPKNNISYKGDKVISNFDHFMPYVGPIKNGNAEGNGHATLSSGSYWGSFKNNKMSGKGVKYSLSGEKSEGEFENNYIKKGEILKFDGRRIIGQFKEGFLDGFGTVIFPDGTIYNGNFIDGLAVGIGEIVNIDGTTTKTSFHEVELKGKAKIKFPNGTTFSGDTKNGKMEGEGKVNFPCGCYYEGDFKNDKFDGNGVFKLHYGGKYIGQFKGGKLDGKGEMVLPTGEKYVGEFKNGVPCGVGILTISGGVQYSGSFKFGKPNGHGIISDNEGSRYECEFIDGKMNGEGKCQFANGDSYIGHIQNNELHGNGTYHFKDGREYSSGFIDGKPNEKVQFSDKNRGEKIPVGGNSGKEVGDVDVMKINGEIVKEVTIDFGHK